VFLLTLSRRQPSGCTSALRPAFSDALLAGEWRRWHTLRAVERALSPCFTRIWCAHDGLPGFAARVHLHDPARTASGSGWTHCRGARPELQHFHRRRRELRLGLGLFARRDGWRRKRLRDQVGGEGRSKCSACRSDDGESDSQLFTVRCGRHVIMTVVAELCGPRARAAAAGDGDAHGGGGGGGAPSGGRRAGVGWLLEPTAVGCRASDPPSRVEVTR
jgi:hypothetical protein